MPGTISASSWSAPRSLEKTETLIDLIGARLDQRPAPILYVGPIRDFLTDQFEPRLMNLLDEAESLAAKVVRGRRMKKTLKIVAGVPVRLAHAGSSAALKSSPAALALVDEYDEMLANVKGQGDPLGLVEARGETYADFVTAITSTPSRGLIETELDARSGLTFWKVGDPEAVESAIWRLWQSGTRHHFSWPCLHCDRYFVPRFEQMRWPENATPAEAARSAQLACPHCGGLHDDDDKTEMNGRGLYVAPGQWVEDGHVLGQPAENAVLSFWASGLASPFVTWGTRVERYVRALASGDPDQLQTALNAGFGECYTPASGRDALDYQEIFQRRQPYRMKELPDGVLRLGMAVDVQKLSLFYTVRGFGSRGTSWLIDRGQLFGPTDDDEVWNALADLMLTPIGRMQIERVFIDSGFRPNKPDAGDEHKVYEFTRRYAWLVSPTKGRATMSPPYRVSKIEVTPKGKQATYSINLVWLSTDFFKSLLVSRIRTPMDQPGSFIVPDDVDEDYCKQLVSEVRVGAPVIVALGWEGSGVRVAFTGTVDEVRSSGSRGGGRTLSISAKGVDTTGKAKEPQQRHFDDKTVADILKEAGSTAGVTEVEVDPGLAGITRTYFEMRDESFIHMGERLAREIGGNFRIQGTVATMSRRGVLYPASVAAVSGRNLHAWDIAPALGRAQYGRVRARWYDPTEAAWKETEETTSLDAEARHDHRYGRSSEGEAIEQTAADKATSERDAGEGSVTIEGDTGAIPDGLCIVVGARPGIDGAYRIEAVTHRYSRGGGFITELELRQPHQGAGADQR